MTKEQKQIKAAKNFTTIFILLRELDFDIKGTPKNYSYSGLTVNAATSIELEFPNGDTREVLTVELIDTLRAWANDFCTCDQQAFVENTLRFNGLI